MLDIYVDADACPVKDEVYKVAFRYNLKVILVTNTWMRVPDDELISLELVSDGPDAADDWIADHSSKGDIVITQDIPLAGRVVKKGAAAISNKGKLYTEDNIGSALASRNLMTDLRNYGEISGSGPAPMQKKDRSLFLQTINEVIQKLMRSKML